jgi:FSR family fosmidomycin resistance protein-like MFS transporter
LLSDTGRRRRVVLAGGGAFILALILFAAAPNFAVLLAASCLFYPASGAFVSLAQATWMDLEPSSTERNMGTWVLAGSIANVLGPLALGAAVAIGSDWRGATLTAATMTVPVLIAASRIRFPEPHSETTDLRAALRGAIGALRERRVRRWLTLLQITDLLQDVFLGFAALYLVDVGGASPELAALGVGVLPIAALVGDSFLLPVLRRIDGLRYLHWTAAAALVVYPAFLLAGSVTGKLVLLVPIGHPSGRLVLDPAGPPLLRAPGPRRDRRRDRCARRPRGNHPAARDRPRRPAAGTWLRDVVPAGCPSRPADLAPVGKRRSA